VSSSRGRIRRASPQWLIPLVVFLILWETVSQLGLVEPVLISSPSAAFRALADQANMRTNAGYSVLALHMLSSVGALALGLLLAAGTGVTLGILMGASGRVYRFLDPLLTVLMPIPGIAWAPLFMLWLGFGMPTIVATGAIAAFFPLAYNTAAGVRSIDPKLLMAARSMGTSQRDILWRVCVPGAAPSILTGLSLAFARGWRTVIAVEMISASLWGLGFMIMEGREYLRPDLIYGGIMVVGIVFLLLEWLVVRRLEEASVGKWGVTKPTESW